MLFTKEFVDKTGCGNRVDDDEKEKSQIDYAAENSVDFATSGGNRNAAR